MPKSTLTVEFEHDFDEQYFKHHTLAEALDSIETALREEHTSGSVGKIRDEGSYEAVWRLKDKEGVEA